VIALGIAITVATSPKINLARLISGECSVDPRGGRWLRLECNPPAREAGGTQH
jgi:hypothetical protein